MGDGHGRGTPVDHFYFSLVLIGVAVLVFTCLLGLQRIVG
jgi:hypothetical protein